MDTHELFDEILELPDPVIAKQYAALIGLDRAKENLLKEGRLLLNPGLLEDWSKKHHGLVLPGVERFQDRPPLILFSGDVGTGKTTLAESFGDPIARAERIRITVLRLSLITRGRGAVGEMTTLVSRAFEELATLASRGVAAGKKPRSAVILVIDEADALAESRAVEQMHHEDRAGVNALIRGIDRFTKTRQPVLIVLCTNRHEAIDPAVLRRAAAHHTFERPTHEQRIAVLRASLGDAFDTSEYEKLAGLLGPDAKHAFGFTFSDISQRFLPGLFLEAFPDAPISFEHAAVLAQRMDATKPFGQYGVPGDPARIPS